MRARAARPARSLRTSECRAWPSAGSPARARRRGTRPPCSSCSAVSTSASTTAAAPSDTSEQSVRLSGRRRTGSSRSRCGRSRSRDPCASARKDCRRRSCGSWRRSSPARRTGRPISGNRARRSCRRCRRSRRRCRPPRARRRPSAGCARSPGAGVVVICSTPTHKHDARGARLDRLEALMHGGRAGRAGVLDPRRALEAQIGRGLQHQRGGEILRRETRR